MEHDDLSLTVPAEAELVRRYHAGELNRPLLIAHLARLPVPSGAANLPSPLKFRFDRGNALIEAAAAHGDLPDASWNKYCQSLCTFAIRARARVRRGALIPIIVTASIGTGSTQYQYNSIFSDGTHLDIDGIPCEASPLEHFFRDNTDLVAQGRPQTIVLPASVLNKLADGLHTIHVSSKLHVEISASCTFSRTATATFTLVTANCPAVSLHADPTLESRMHNAFNAPTIIQRSGQTVDVGFHALNVPCLVVCDVILKARGREWNLSRDRRSPEIFYPAGNEETTFHDQLNNFPTDFADIVLRPDPVRAEGLLDVNAIWASEIVIPHVPIRRIDYPN